MEEYFGVWELSASANTESEIDLVDQQFQAEFDTLSVSAIDLIPIRQQTTG